MLDICQYVVNIPGERNIYTKKDKRKKENKRKKKVESD